MPISIPLFNVDPQPPFSFVTNLKVLGYLSSYFLAISAVSSLEPSSTIKISSSSLYTELVNGSNASSKYLETLYAAIDTVKIFWFITPSL